MTPTENITQLFLNFTLKKFNKKLFGQLAPGLPADEIRRIAAEAGVNLPDDAVSLYTVTNGVKPDSGLDERLFFDNGILMPVQQAAGEYKTFSYNPGLDKMFPLFDSGGGDFLLIDCDPERNTYNQVLIYAPAMLVNEPQVIYFSIINLFAVAIRGFMQGAYRYEGGELQVNYEVLVALALEINPSAEYWINEF